MMTFDYGPGNGKTGFAADMFKLRFWRLRLSQSAFAERYGLTVSALKDQERMRYRPSRALKVMMAAIELDPAFMQRAADLAKERWG